MKPSGGIKALLAKLGGRAFSLSTPSNPQVIGATGGSGTRVLARLLRRGGTYTGTRLNDSEDAIEIGLFLNDWIPPYIESEHLGGGMDPAAREEMSRQFQEAFARHLQPMEARGGSYGWKEPRGIYLLPFFHSQFPGLRFLHLVRDGRDMAFSSNQNQLNKYGASLIPSELAGWPQPVRAIALWSRVNQWAADYGEARMRGRYLRVRFEDLCADPLPQARRIWDFFGLRGDPAEAVRIELAPPSSLGRWAPESPDVLGVLHEYGGTALRRFGYL